MTERYATCPYCGSELLQSSCSQVRYDLVAASALECHEYCPEFSYIVSDAECENCGIVGLWPRWYFNPESGSYDLRKPVQS